MISDVCAPNVKLLYPSDTCSAHTGVSICVLMSCVNSWWGDVLLSKKFYHGTLLKKHLLAGHFLAQKYDYMTGPHDMIFILAWDYRWIQSYVAHCNISWHPFVTPWCSVLLVRPLYKSAHESFPCMNHTIGAVFSVRCVLIREVTIKFQAWGPWLLDVLFVRTCWGRKNSWAFSIQYVAKPDEFKARFALKINKEVMGYSANTARVCCTMGNYCCNTRSTQHSATHFRSS
jgi:hypothetical protein